MTRRNLAILGIVVLFGLAAQTELFGQPKDRLDKWEYTVLRHSPHLREGGSDLKRLQGLGREGWEVASSYKVKGEIIVSIMKRRR